MIGLERLGQRIAREQDALRLRAQDRAAVREHLGSMEVPAALPSHRRLGLGIAGAALAAMVAAALLLWARPLGQEPLTLTVGRSQKAALVGTWIEAPERESLRLRFSDGTRIEMSPRSRARVVGLDMKGAHLLLESGHARVEVVRRPHAAWRLSMGPFAVRVTGTRFDVRWNPEQDSFELDLEEGHVQVSGCVFGQGYAMSAGQKVDASCSSRRFNVADRRGNENRDAASSAGVTSVLPSAPEPPAAVMGAVVVAPERQPARNHAPARTTQTERTAAWRASAERGRYAAAFAAAKAAGFAAVCAHADADSLSMLADAARYAKEPDDEAHALHLLRRRFAGTPRAALAAFGLGRLSFDVRRSYQEAAEWFGTYLREQPRGALRREARGRLMEATLAMGERDRAHELAVRYLRDYPDGPHAELARGIRTTSDP